MKKIWIALSVIVVVRLGSIIYLETQLLDEPIILAQDASLKENALYVSYITNTVEPHEISHVEIGGTYFYPIQATDPFEMVLDFDSNQLTENEFEYVRGRIYSIHAVKFPLEQENRDINFSKETSAIIHFKDGKQWEKPLKVGKPLMAYQILREERSVISNEDTVIDTYVTEQDIILTKVDVGELENVTLAINREQVEIPLKTAITIPKDTQIEISYKQQLDFYPSEQYEILLKLLDENNIPTEITVGSYKLNPPSSSWIREMVKERGK